MFAFAAVLLNVDAAFACTPKWKAYVTAMKSDLRNLVSAEDDFRKENHRYSTNLGELGVRPSTGVAAVLVTIASDSSYVAQATHTKLTSMTCFIYVGGPRPSGAVVSNAHAGEPWCEGDVPSNLMGRRTLRSSYAQALWILVAALALAGILFLRARDQRNWKVRGLVSLAILYPVFVFSGSCGTPLIEPAMVVVALSLTLFTFALRSLMVAGEAHP